MIPLTLRPTGLRNSAAFAHLADWCVIEDRAPTHGHEPTREAAMAAFAKSWRRE
jgi:hypothetical protein